jgi:hypothetical protein
MSNTTTSMRRLTIGVVTVFVVAGLPTSAGARPASRVKLSVTDVSVVEGNSGTSTAFFTVHAGGKGFREASADYHTVDGSASESQDYTASVGTVSFANGRRDQRVSIVVLGDTVDEADERFSVRLVQPVKAVINDATGVGTIVDDDVSEPQDPGTGDPGTGDPGTGDPGTGDPGTGADNTAGGASGRADSRITLQIGRRSRIFAKGWLFPAHADKRVVVKLLKKVGGRFVAVRTKRPVLGRGRDIDHDGTRESKYQMDFRMPRAKRCRVVVKFRGDADHKPSSARRTFSC